MDDTIFALSSGFPPSGIAVIRISGGRTEDAVRTLCPAGLPAPRALMRRTLVSPATLSPESVSKTPKTPESVLDEGMVVWMPGPATFSGEDYAEFHLHGGRAVVAAVLEALGRVEGCRLARAGEFSRRAFDNGKLDLSAAEGLADLIAAETEAQRRQALRQLGGHLAQRCLAWQDSLKGALAHMEASIDFSDQDLPDGLDRGAREMIEGVCAGVRRCLDDGGAGERIRDGVRIAILGPPNAGKSSLLNRLAGRDAAITSERAGTTRDVIEVNMEIGGYAVVLSDTAGMRSVDAVDNTGAVDAVEQEGMRRASAAAEQAHIRLVLLDGAAWPAHDTLSTAWLETRGTMDHGTGAAIGALNKSDLMGDMASHELRLNGHALLPLSAKTGDGMDRLVRQLEQEIARRWGHGSGEGGGGGEATLITRLRHREALDQCHRHLNRTLSAQGSELWAEDLRLALRALGRIVGQVDVEDMLDIIFNEFCIGK